MKIFLSFALFLLSFTSSVRAQEQFEYFISINGNLYVPRNSEKGIYPVVGYDKEVKPKVLIGGFGVGVAGFKKIMPKLILKVQANLSRSVYWETFIYTNGPNQSDIIGVGSASSTDYTLGLTATPHYQISKLFSVGTGIGVQTMLISALYIRDNFPNTDFERFVGYNRFYKTFMPVVPIEFSINLNKMLVNVRYEHGLLNRFKKDIAEYKNDRYGLLFFEVGYRIR
jgi:hypothetical protein